LAQDAPTPNLPDNQIAELANRLVGRAKDAKCKPPDCKILVADFTLDSGLTSQLGMALADKLTEALASHTSVVVRSSLRRLIEQEGISEKTLSSDDAKRWLGDELGAAAVVMGTTKADGDALRLRVRLYVTEGKTRSKSEEEDMVFPYPDLETGLSPVDPFSPNSRTHAPGARVFRAGTQGVSGPSCQYCPLPSYTAAAREAKVQGQVVLDVTVSSEGTMQDARVIRGFPFGMTRSAIQAVQGWKFKPAMREGMPVNTAVVIEVSFRMF
jgi:TonB family protein